MRVELSSLALRNRDILLKGIAERHSAKAADRLNNHISIYLSKLPKLPRKNVIVHTRQFGEVHRAIVADLTIILYRIKGDVIEVLNITDGRADWQ